MPELSDNYLKRYVLAQQRVLSGNDWIIEYLSLMHDLALGGATPTELDETVRLWAGLYREKVEKIYPQYKNAKLDPVGQYQMASDEEKQRMIGELFMHNLIDAYRRDRSNEAIAEWILIVIGATFIVLLIVYGEKIENVPTWILLVGTVVLLPVLMFLGACTFCAQLAAAHKIQRALRALKSFVGSGLMRRSNKKEEK